MQGPPGFDRAALFIGDAYWAVMGGQGTTRCASA